ncbi:S2/P23 family protein [Borreliella valaisiana]|uniref:Protein p23 n=1 Tax=Borreliella valaisiana VS116 TaxID=445987 RepID=C0R8L7_BORVA|nr:S2/P23 family protein [Borreliella valaisiana]ACN52797.1 protein p23 [Borreliella valaisiana VS116]
MKKGIYILNIIFFISFFYSCFLVPKSLKKVKTEISEFGLIEEYGKKNIEEYNKKNVKEYNKNVYCIDEESILDEIKEGEVFELFAGGYVTWAKSGKLRAIKDKYNNLIQDLRGLKYSYIFSPIRFKTLSLWLSYNYYINDNNYKILGNSVPIAKIIAFESNKEFEEKYEVKSLKLISEGSNIDFEQYRVGVAKISLKESSKEFGYINSYNFGVFNDDLSKSFEFLYKKNKCNNMLAKLTIKNKQTNEDKVYEIVLNTKLFYNAVKLILSKYPNLSSEKLKLSVDYE